MERTFERKSTRDLEPFSPSVQDFCHFIEYCSRQQSVDPQHLALLCEEQAEAVRIGPKDISPETVDLLLNTMLNILTHLAEGQEQRRWSNRLKAAVFEGLQGQQSLSQQPRLHPQYSS